MYILISGYKGSGKTTAAEYLFNKLNAAKIPTEVCSLSTIIKTDVAFLTRYTLAEIDRLKRDESSSMRRLLQVYGAVMREKDPNYFLSQALQKPGTEVVIVPEVRFPNEIEYFKTKDKCLLLYVIRNVLMDDMDPSEQMAIRGNLPADYTVENSGTLDDLHSMLDRIMEEVLRDLS